MTLVKSTVRIDKQAKQTVDAQLKQMGLSFNSFVNLAVTQFLIQGKIPFSIQAPLDIPNETTQKAIDLVEKEESGEVPDTIPFFSDSKKMIEYMKNYKEHDEKK